MSEQPRPVSTDDQAHAIEGLEHLSGDEEKRDQVLNELIDRLTGFDSCDPPIPGSPIPVPEFRSDYRDEGLDWPSSALTMVGRRRLGNLRHLIEDVVRRGVEGDIVETGVWRGGASMYARAVLATLGVRDRRVFVADSFEGLPAPNADRWPLDHGSTLHEHDALAVGLDDVKDNFRRMGLLDDAIVFVPGWFRDTMPTLPVETIAILRLDGDMYESTIDPLTHLYDKVSPGGWVIVDDYILEPCARAVHDFLSARGLDLPMEPIDRIGSYFQKPA